MRVLNRAALWLLLCCPSVSLTAQDTFHGCKSQGNAKPAAIKKVNEYKNREAAPADSDIDSTATLTKILKIGDDTNRFDDDNAAEIVGYV